MFDTQRVGRKAIFLSNYFLINVIIRRSEKSSLRSNLELGYCEILIIGLERKKVNKIKKFWEVKKVNKLKKVKKVRKFKNFNSHKFKQ